MCVCLSLYLHVCEQNSTGPEEDPEAIIFWLYCHPFRTQSGGAARMSSIPGECLTQYGLKPEFGLPDILCRDSFHYEFNQHTSNK